MNFRDSVHLEKSWGLFISRIKRGVRTPIEEIEIIIDGLKNKSRVAVLSSGGIDSELMVNLISRKMPVAAVAYKFIYENRILNSHDLEYLSGISDNINVTVKEYSIDLKEFWNSSWYWDFIKKYRCTSPQLPVHAYMCELAYKQGYYPVLTEMQPELKMFEDGSFHFEEKEKDYSIVRYLRDNKIDCLESPLQCNPEILYSILTSIEFKNYMKQPENQRDSSAFKRQQYQSWFNVDLIERPKFHGFEGSEDIDNYYRKQIFEKFGYDDIRLFIPYNVLINSLCTSDRLFLTSDPDVHDWFRRGFNPI